MCISIATLPAVIVAAAAVLVLLMLVVAPGLVQAMPQPVLAAVVIHLWRRGQAAGVANTPEVPIRPVDPDDPPV